MLSIRDSIYKEYIAAMNSFEEKVEVTDRNLIDLWIKDIINNYIP